MRKMRREDLYRKADEMRANIPAIFQFAGMDELDAVTIVDEVRLELSPFQDIHFYIVKPKAASGSLPFVVNLHGGGMVRNHGERDILFCRRLAFQTGCAVISIDYHLAPQYPYPYALDEIEAIIRYLFEKQEILGLDSRYILCGQSSGGNLALVTTLRLKDGIYRPQGQILCYSWLDIHTNPGNKADNFPDGRKELYDFYKDCYVRGANTKDWEISPFFASESELERLPATVIVEGGLDELRSENMQFFRRLCDAGVHAVMFYYPDSVHGFLVNQMADWKNAQRDVFQEIIKMFELTEDK